MNMTSLLINIISGLFHRLRQWIWYNVRYPEWRGEAVGCVCCHRLQKYGTRVYLAIIFL